MRLRSLLLVFTLVRLAAAQSPAPTATVSGVVHDSIAHAPLPGAMIQLVAADGQARSGRTTVSDSLGRFTLDSVPDGRYALGFFHPMLDSLGVEAPLRTVSVIGQRSMRVDLAIPSAERLRSTICHVTGRADSASIIVGTVRNAKDQSPAAGVSVLGEWLEFAFTPKGFQRHVQKLVATTGENGWFAICNVPNEGIVSLLASRGADSTDLIEVQVPTDGFLRRDLYLGGARTIMIAGDTTVADSIARLPRRVHLGDGLLTGTVIGTNNQPISNAQVAIAGGPRTRSNERGEFTLPDAPAGTRMMEVRALGFYPESRRVDVFTGAPPTRVVLSNLKAVLDTIRVVARADNMKGFEERRRSGQGRYLTAEEIARRGELNTSALFRNLPGVHVERISEADTASAFFSRTSTTTAMSDKQLVMRGTFSEKCIPAVYLNGHRLPAGLSAEDLDVMVRPEEITGIEVYTGGTAPGQFQAGLTGCGSVAIWRK